MFTFIRIPKNASTTVYEAFGDKNVIAQRLPEKHDEILKTPYCSNIYHPSHVTLEMAVEYFGEDILDYPIVCVCRNPYDRLVSAYHYAKQSGLLMIHGHPDLTFEQFVYIFCNRVGDNDFFHSTRQVDFLRYQGKIMVDWELQYEYLGSDWEAFTENFDCFTELKHANKSYHEPWNKYYTRDLEKIVYDTYEEDFDYFKYGRLIK